MEKAWRLSFHVTHKDGTRREATVPYDMNQGAIEDSIGELMQDELASRIVILLKDVTAEHK